MSKMIQVRNVPDSVHRILKARAAEAGMSLSDYIKRDLEASAAQATMEEIYARVKARRSARGGSGLRREDIVATLREIRGE
jgi:plasmid stability protein